jgi:hypothetical protein
MLDSKTNRILAPCQLSQPFLYTVTSIREKINRNLDTRPELAVGTELELEKLVTELALVSDIVAKIEIVAHFFPGINHNYDIK